MYQNNPRLSVSLQSWIILQNKSGIEELKRKLEECENYFSSGKFDLARINFTKLQEALIEHKEQNSDDAEADCLLVLVNCHLERLKSKQNLCYNTLNVLNDMIARSKEIDFLDGEVLALKYLLLTHEMRGNYELADNLNERILRIAKKKKNSEYEALALMNSGRLSWRQGNYTRAWEYYSNALEIYQKLNDRRGIGKAYHYLGNVLQRQGKSIEAKENYEKALKLFRKLNMLQYEAGALNNLAIVKKSEGNLSEAIELHEQSMKIRKEIGDSLGLSLSLRNIANLQTERGEYKKALSNYEKALEIRLQAKDQHGLATLYSNMAELFYNTGDLAKAADHYQKSLEIYRNIGLEDNLVEHLCKYSELLIHLKDQDRAQELINEAKFLAERHESVIEKSIVSLHMAILEKSRENLGKTRDYFITANKLARKNNYNHVLLRSSIFLAETNLQKFKISMNPDQFHLATTYINEALKISRKENLIPTIVSTLMVKSALLSVNLDFNNSLAVLEEANELCVKNGLILLQKRVESQKKQTEDRMLMFRRTYEEHKRQLLNINTNDALNLLDLLNRSQNTARFEPSSLYLTVYKHDSRGSVVLITDELPFEENTPNVLETMGFFFSLAIGQGHRHHEGLFGALPLVNETNHSALIYSVAMKDKEQTDPRMKGMNFILFCLVYQNNLGHYFYDRLELESIFKNYVEKMNDISEITLENLQQLKKDIVDKMSYI